MAARLEAVPAVRSLDLIDLRKLSSGHLDTLLEEETGEWKDGLDWDFSKSADLVRRFVDLRALSGAALMAAGEAVGYSYCVVEEHKGLIGDLYVRGAWRTVESETPAAGRGARRPHYRISSAPRRIATDDDPASRAARYARRGFPENLRAQFHAARSRCRASPCGGTSAPPHARREMVGPLPGERRATDRGGIRRPHRQPDQRPVPLGRRSAALPVTTSCSIPVAAASSGRLLM